MLLIGFEPIRPLRTRIFENRSATNYDTVANQITTVAINLLMLSIDQTLSLTFRGWHYQ